MRQLLILLLVLFSTITSHATETLSYLYIQGDKQTPFYVKLEDEMQPRYGKNYSIIPQLAPGPIHIEILFQQNAFPPHKFTILIPDGGSRGFLLVKKDDSFALYDLQQGFYLAAGNSEEDDHLPTVSTAIADPVVTQPVEQQVIPANTEKDTAKLVKTEKEKTKLWKPKAKVVTTPKPVKTDGSPTFIPDIELTKPAGTASTTGDSASISTISGIAIPIIVNSDCPSAMSSAEFSKIFSPMAAYSTDEERLEFMQGKMDVCYESWQARALAQMLSGDAARYTLLKKMYPRVADQGAFPLLDDLFTSDIWKAEFARLVHR
jgi:hypothetical protein